MASLNATENNSYITIGLHPDPGGLGYIYFNFMNTYKNNIAQTDGLTGECDTYGDLLTRSIQTSLMMKSKGIQPGDIVTLCTFNHLNGCVPYFASFFIGTVSSSLDPALSQDDITHLLKHVPLKMIFTVPESLGMIERALEELSLRAEIVVFGPTTIHTPFDAFLQSSEDEEGFRQYEAESLQELAVVFFSSGTSSLPKAILEAPDLFFQNLTIKQCGELPINTRICLAYGQTESAGFLAGFQPAKPTDLKLLAEKPASTGRGVSGITYKVIDLDTEDLLGPYQRGELCYKTGILMSGYYNQDSSHIRDDQGWVRSGDVVYHDKDQCFYVVDRVKEMLKFQSFHVPPAVVENVLAAHPAVKRPVVIGVPHDIDGDHPMAIGELNEFQETDPEQIVKFVDERVHGRYRVRAAVRIVDHIPLTPPGKINRRRVKETVRKNAVNLK